MQGNYLSVYKLRPAKELELEKAEARPGQRFREARDRMRGGVM
jgi:hypothetical protein